VPKSWGGEGGNPRRERAVVYSLSRQFSQITVGGPPVLGGGVLADTHAKGRNLRRVHADTYDTWSIRAFERHYQLFQVLRWCPSFAGVSTPSRVKHDVGLATPRVPRLTGRGTQDPPPRQSRPVSGRPVPSRATHALPTGGVAVASTSPEPLHVYGLRADAGVATVRIDITRSRSPGTFGPPCPDSVQIICPICPICPFCRFHAVLQTLRICPASVRICPASVRAGGGHAPHLALTCAPSASWEGGVTVRARGGTPSVSQQRGCEGASWEIHTQRDLPSVFRRSSHTLNVSIKVECVIIWTQTESPHGAGTPGGRGGESRIWDGLPCRVGLP
jgi:hypothetical protein